MNGINLSITRTNSGNLQSLLRTANRFPSANVERADNSSLIVTLNEAQNILDPGVLKEPFHISSLRTELVTLKADLDRDRDQVATTALQAVLDRNQTISTVTLIQNRGQSLGINTDNLCAIKSKTQQGLEAAGRWSYRNDIDVVLTITKLLTPDVAEIEGKDVLLFFGPTRSGKSTTMLYLDGTPLALKSTDDLGLEDTVADTVITTDHPNDPSAATIGHDTLDSHTFFPAAHFRSILDHPNVVMLDFPGLLDSSGWQVRLGLDLVLKSVFTKANSVRVVAVLEKDAFISAAGDIAKRTVSRLNNLLIDPTSSALIAVTKHNRPANDALRRTLESVTERLSYRLVNQSDRDALPALINDLVSLRAARMTNKTVVADDDLIAFQTCLNTDENLTVVVGSILKHFMMSDNPSNLVFGNDQYVAYWEGIGNLIAMLDNPNIPSILGHYDSDIRGLYQMDDRGLNASILNLERRVADGIFRSSVYGVAPLWKAIVKEYEDGKLSISEQDWSRLRARVDEINKKIGNLLDEKNITMADCQPRGIWDSVYRFISTPSNLINVADLILHIVRAVATKKPDAAGMSRAIRDLIDGYTDCISNNNNPVFLLVNGYLDQFFGLVDASFKRGAMIDREITRYLNH